MMVTGKDEVNVLLYAFNTKSKGGEKHKLFLATIKNNTPTYKDIPIAVDADFQNSIGKYNPITKQLVFLNIEQLTNKEARKKKLRNRGRNTYYSTTVFLIDQASKNVKVLRDFNMDKLNQESVAYYGKRRATFSGVPQNLFMNQDGSFTVVLEGYKVVTSTTTTSSGGTRTTYTYYTEDLGVLSFDKMGTQLDSKFIPKSQVYRVMSVYPLYHNDYENSTFPINGGDQFKSFAYLNGKNGNYIMYNESQKNIERLTAEKKAKTTKSVSGLDGFYYSLNGMEAAPKAKKMFGGTAGKNHKLGLFGVSDYDNEKDIYATLKLEVQGRAKKMRVVWMQPD